MNSSLPDRKKKKKVTQQIFQFSDQMQTCFALKASESHDKNQKCSFRHHAAQCNETS